jgi:plasmid stability protein
MSNVISATNSRKTTIGVVLDQELRERLEETAHANERSVGAEVRVALKRHLEPHDSRKGGAMSNVSAKSRRALTAQVERSQLREED